MEQKNPELLALETMDVTAFLSSALDSIAWPITVVVLALMLRKPLNNILQNIRRIRYGDLEFDFSLELQKLEGKAKTAGLQIPRDLQTRTSQPRTPEDAIADAWRLAEDFPEPAVGVAWLAVEHELMQAVMRLAISPDYPPHNAPAKNISLLHEGRYIDSDMRAVLERMRRLRNAAVHPWRDEVRISAGEAQEFAVLAQAVTRRLQSISR